MTNLNFRLAETKPSSILVDPADGWQLAEAPEAKKKLQVKKYLEGHSHVIPIGTGFKPVFFSR